MQCPAGFGRANEPGIDHADSNGSRPESPRRLGLDNDHEGCAMHAWCLLVPCPCLISEPCVHSVSLPPASSASGRLQSNPVQNDGVQCLSPIDVSNEASHGATTFAVAGDFPALSAGWVLRRRCVDRHRLLSCSMLYHVRSFFFLWDQYQVQSADGTGTTHLQHG